MYFSPFFNVCFNNHNTPLFNLPIQDPPFLYLPARISYRLLFLPHFLSHTTLLPLFNPCPPPPPRLPSLPTLLSPPSKLVEWVVREAETNYMEKKGFTLLLKVVCVVVMCASPPGKQRKENLLQESELFNLCVWERERERKWEQDR